MLFCKNLFSGEQEREDYYKRYDITLEFQPRATDGPSDVLVAGFEHDVLCEVCHLLKPDWFVSCISLDPFCVFNPNLYTLFW